MACHTIHLSARWFPLVQSGEKVYEGRCNWKQAKEYKKDDTLYIIHQDDATQSFFVRIVQVHQRSSFRAALEEFGIAKVLPGVASVDEGVQVYAQYVRESTQKEHGVLLFELALVKLPSASK
jgi:ASC-1-like (ASCH) protein